MSKKFDDVLWEAWQAAHRQYCSSEGHIELVRWEFEQWRAEFSGINKIGQGEK